MLTTGILAAGTPAFALPVHCYHAQNDYEGQVDQSGARLAVKRGDAAPYEKLLRKLRPQIHGEIVGVRLEQHQGIWVYEFRVVMADGHMHTLHFGARSGQPISIKPVPCASY